MVRKGPERESPSLLTRTGARSGQQLPLLVEAQSLCQRSGPGSPGGPHPAHSLRSPATLSAQRPLTATGGPRAVRPRTGPDQRLSRVSLSLPPSPANYIQAVQAEP